MSDSSKKKEMSSEQPLVFTIELDHSGQSGEIPDVSDLLGNLKKTAKKTISDPVQEKTDKIESKAVRFMIKSLKEFDTALEIHFILKEDGYHYLQHSSLGNQSFIGLDEIFQNMKIPHSFFESGKEFEEFSKKEKGWLFDAFGVTDRPFLQFIQHQSKKVLTVYVSGKTMAEKKESIVSYTEHKNKNLSASTIDLDVAS